MPGLLSDLRYALRLLRRNTGFSAVAVLTLALGIGANAAIFTVVNAVVLAPLPYPTANRLVRVWDSFPAIGFPRANSNALEFVRLRQGSRTLSQVAAYGGGTATLTGHGTPERVVAGRFSSNLLDVLGARPMLGRGFRADEEDASHAAVAILSHRLWQRRFASDPAIVGRAITLDGRACTVVGVMPAEFRTPLDLKSSARAEVWRPLGLEPSAPPLSDVWQAHSLHVVGLLREGRAVADAQADAARVVAEMMRDYPEMYPKGIVFNVIAAPAAEDVVGSVRPALLLLLAAVGLVLIIACANVANLLLTRAQGRQKELAVRAAVGASRVQVVRQLLVESVALALAGGTAGLGVAWAGLRALLALAPASLPRAESVTIGGPALWFTMGVSLATGVAFGLVPALHGTRTDLQARLKERAATPSSGAGLLRRGLVVAEVALAVLVVVGAGLLVRSLWHVQHVDPGFRTEGLLTMQLSPAEGAYPSGAEVVGYYRRVLERSAAVPGVAAATLVGPLPVGGGSNDGSMQVEGRVQDWTRGNFSADYRVVETNYFAVMGVRLRRGRTFTGADREGAPPVVVVNETLARRHFANEDPIGRRVRLLDGSPDTATSPYMTIVGVVDDARNRGLTTDVHQEMYLPLGQHPQSAPGVQTQMSLVLEAAGRGDPGRLAGDAMRAAWSVDPSVPVTNVLTMADVVGATVAQPRFNALLLGLFALLALVLGAVGIYGLMSHAVAQRVNEIGLRLALGATPGTVLWGVMREGLALTGVGVAAGLAAGLAGARVMASLLFEVAPADPLTFAAAPLVLVAVAAGSCLVPALRATRVDPITALRSE
jgi:putative ABC transport system permease protein